MAAPIVVANSIGDLLAWRSFRSAFAALSEQATKLTKIVFEGVKQLPTRA
jgi:hypothetical protein